MRSASLPWILFTVLMMLGVAAQGATTARSPVLLVLGDSLSAAYRIPREAGWVRLLQQRLRREGYNYRVVNASIPGDTTAGGLARLPPALKRYRPSLVVIELGGNDGLQGLPLGQMKSNLSKMIGLARKSGAKTVLVGVRMPPNYGPEYTKRFEAVFREVAKADDIPLVPELLAGVATHRDLMQAGGLHPIAKAEPRLLANVWRILEPLLTRDTSAPIATSR